MSNTGDIKADVFEMARHSAEVYGAYLMALNKCHKELTELQSRIDSILSVFSALKSQLDRVEESVFKLQESVEGKKAENSGVVYHYFTTYPPQPNTLYPVYVFPYNSWSGQITPAQQDSKEKKEE